MVPDIKAYTVSAIFMQHVQMGKIYPASAQSYQIIAEEDDRNISNKGTVQIVIGGYILHVPSDYIDNMDGFQNRFGYLRLRALLPCLTPEIKEQTLRSKRLSRNARARA
jgi:hypothetical protein